MSNPPLEKIPLPQPVVETALQSWGRAGKHSIFSISGNSMRPFLLPGDTVLIAYGCEQARPGDLLAFRQGTTLIVHRLLQMRTDGSAVMFLLKGDNRNQPDPLVPSNRVVGRVCAIHRGETKVNLEAPAWRTASRAIAASARLSLAIDRWGRRATRQLVGPSPNPFFASIRRAVLTLLSIPGRVLSWMLWSRS